MFKWIKNLFKSKIAVIINGTHHFVVSFKIWEEVRNVDKYRNWTLVRIDYK